MKHRLTVLLALLVCPSLCWGQSATVLSSGAIEFLQVSYLTSNPSNPWAVTIHDELNFVSYTPTQLSLTQFTFDRPSGATFYIGGPQHLFTRPSDDATWGFIGVGGGQLFRATPQNGAADRPSNPQLMMGIALGSELRNAFVGSQLTITMTAISGPGQFSYYENDNFPESAVGPIAIPRLSTLTGLTTFNYSDSQNFFNMGFSAPGIYNIDFQFSGTLIEGNTPVTSGNYTYTFEVAPFAVPEPATWVLMGITIVGIGISIWQVRRRRRLALDALVPDPR